LFPDKEIRSGWSYLGEDYRGGRDLAEIDPEYGNIFLGDTEEWKKYQFLTWSQIVESLENHIKNKTNKTNK